MQRQETRPYGVRLRAERLRLGLTQAAFALAVGVSKTSQVSYESDLYTPDLAYLEAATRIGVDPMFVLSGEVEPRRTADRFNWQLAEDILALVDEWALHQDRAVTAFEKMKMIRYFYKRFCGGGAIDDEAVADGFELAEQRA